MRDRTGGDTINVLVGVDKQTSLKMVVVAKDRTAGNEATVAEVIGGLRQMGHYGTLIIKTDGEPSLVELMTRVATKREAGTVLQRSPPHDSQANGLVERAVRSVEEQTRTIKLDVDRRLNMNVSVTDVIFEWILRHSVALLNWFQVGFDGRTAHHRLHGRPYRGELVPMCTGVLFRHQHEVHGGLMRERWSAGMWVGKSMATGEHQIWPLDGSRIVNSRSIRLRDEDTRAETVRGLTEGPRDHRARHGPRQPVQPVPQPQQPGARRIRQWQITRVLFTEYGAIPGCLKCSN